MAAYPSSDNRHVPASHPVAVRMRKLAARRAAEMRAALDEMETQQAWVSEALESIGRTVARLPAVPFTNEHREMALMIASELRRRSRSVKTREQERSRAQAQHVEVEQRYAAIAAAVANDPRRTLRSIAAEYGVSVSLVSQVAVARGARRRVRAA